MGHSVVYVYTGDSIYSRCEYVWSRSSSGSNQPIAIIHISVFKQNNKFLNSDLCLNNLLDFAWCWNIKNEWKKNFTNLYLSVATYTRYIQNVFF